MIVSFAIGNSDDKLSQASWAAYVADVTDLVGWVSGKPGAVVHFAGFARPELPWQNALWAIELTGQWADECRQAMRTFLAQIAGRYGQDSIAWWEAHEADMITPPDGAP